MFEFRLLIFVTIFSLFFDATLNYASANGLPVFVSILPQKYFVQQIGKDRVEVQVMVQPGASPATYEPKPAQMTALSAARIYFSIGVPFENVWLEKIAAANPQMAIVPTDRGILKLSISEHHHGEQVHGTEGGHRPGLEDPHIWTSPPLVMTQARNILTALQDYDPINRDFYEANYKIFIKELIDLDIRLRQILAEKKGASFLVFHPSWGYFAHTYGLKQVAIEFEGKDPKPAQLQALISQARKERIKVIFAQPQFSFKSAEIVARAIGGKVVPADPLAADWSSNLLNQAMQFEAAMR